MPVSLIIAIIFAVVSGLVALEIISLTGRADKLVYACDVHMSLCEPDELVTLTFRVRNASLLPVMYVGFSVLFDDAIEVRESDEWLAKHSQGGLFGNMFSFDFFLMPHRTYRGKIRFSLKERGLHRIGKVYLERGDYYNAMHALDQIDFPTRDAEWYYQAALSHRGRLLPTQLSPSAAAPEAKPRQNDLLVVAPADARSAALAMSPSFLSPKRIRHSFTQRPSSE